MDESQRIGLNGEECQTEEHYVDNVVISNHWGSGPWHPDRDSASEAARQSILRQILVRIREFVIRENLHVHVLLVDI